jgi:hypothetical protein
VSRPPDRLTAGLMGYVLIIPAVLFSIYVVAAGGYAAITNPTPSPTQNSSSQVMEPVPRTFTVTGHDRPTCNGSHLEHGLFGTGCTRLRAASSQVPLSFPVVPASWPGRRPYRFLRRFAGNGVAAMGIVIGLVLLLLMVGFALVVTRPNARTRRTDRQLARRRRAVRRPGRNPSGAEELGGGHPQHYYGDGPISGCGSGGGGSSDSGGGGW